jgi:hypothetical protein
LKNSRQLLLTQKTSEIASIQLSNSIRGIGHGRSIPSFSGRGHGDDGPFRGLCNGLGVQPAGVVGDVAQTAQQDALKSVMRTYDDVASHATQQITLRVGFAASHGTKLIGGRDRQK